MPGIFQGLDIARRAIWASRLGMDVASHNIANVNTPGFSRQQVKLEAALPMAIPGGQLGLGVNTGTIERVRNRLLDYQFRRASDSFGKAEIKENILYQVENVIQEPSESSIGTLMEDFFAQFSALASEPENTSLRNTLVQKAISLVDAFRGKKEQIAGIQQSLRGDIQSSINQINQIAGQIAGLNRDIGGTELNGATANDLRDQRDLLLDQLSELIDVQYSEDSFGRMTVSSGGLNLVSGDVANAVKMDILNDSSIRIEVQGANGQAIDSAGGRLGGLLETHNRILTGISKKIDSLAEQFIDEVNRVHRAGKGLPAGNPPTAKSGLDFFIGTDASTINISPEILDNVANIALSRDGTPGNGDVALTIANLRNRKMFEDGTQTFADYYTNIVNDLGLEIDSARSTRSQQQLLKDQIQTQRQADSGVSLDEEMTNLIKYQRSLEAATKVIKVVDEVLDTVINMV